MIDSTTLTEQVNEYLNKCYQTHTRPSYKGLARQLKVSGQTISNVNRGTYNGGTPYGIEPCKHRCIDNKDFEIVQSVFESKKYTV